MGSADHVQSRTCGEILRARAITDRIFRHVKPEAWLDRPIPERHRLLFYAGHLEAFDWNQIGVAALGLGPINASFDQLFAFGIDPPPGELPQDRVEDWPPVKQALDYAAEVRRRVSKVMDDAPEQVLHIVLEHRLMHAETLTYMLHNLSYDRRILGPVAAPSHAGVPDHQMLYVSAGTVTMGRQRHSGFGWDNEYGEHSVLTPDFRIGKYKVTNDQYLKFVRQGGPVPHYWLERRGQWFYRGMFAEVPLPGDWPVYVSHSQATAYAEWAGKSLPSEQQFHRAAFGSPEDAERPYPWGNDVPLAIHGNFDFAHPDAISVRANPAGDSAFGVSQLVGNGWEWTRTPFHPFPGFEPFPSYPGYSANFFDGNHYVLKGASCATDASLIRPTFRNWFRAHYPYAYATFRLIEE
jgi:formylglycine-generating enzyme required for sulfatase activity